MSVLNVGFGKGYSTISDAITNSVTGDTIYVSSGTYTNDFITISHSLDLIAVEAVMLVATVQPPNGKAYITEGAGGLTVNIKGAFDIGGVTVRDGNGAAIRYEGGTLQVDGATIHDNQDGILGGPDADGAITITGTTFTNNGSGTGLTHDLYIGDVASLVVRDSVFTSANGGHEIKSRAQNNIIVDNRITDVSGTASYQIDLPNGGTGVIQGNVIEKGPTATNPVSISFGEEGAYADSSLIVQGNTIVNNYTGHATTAVRASAGTVSVTGNAVFGFTSTVSGTATDSGNQALPSLPNLAALLPSASAVVSFTDTTAGTSGTAAMAEPGADSPFYLTWQYIWSSTDSVAMSTAVPNSFLHGGAGSDALLVTSGQNVLDGGAGSNFLVGGTGNDTFFADARGGEMIWDTLVNFNSGDMLTLWGYTAAASALSWDAAVAGADGYQGATLRTTVDGASVSVTFAGLSIADGKGLAVSNGTAGGVPYLMLSNT